MLTHLQCLFISIPLAIICLIIIICTVKFKTSTISLSLSAANSRTHPMIYMQRNKPDRRSPEGPMMVNMRCRNGVLLIQFIVGSGQRMEAVFDTGSENLIVAGSGCVGSKHCSSSNGYYDPMMTELKETRQTTISYGTQKDVVKWYRETVKIETIEYKDNMLNVLLESDEHDQEYIHNQEHKTMIINTANVGVVQTRTGSSDLNVFGFGKSAHPLTVRNTILEMIDKVFTMVIYHSSGWLVLGKIVKNGKHLDIPRIPLERDCYFKKYFCVSMINMQVVNGRDVYSCVHRPTYAIIDTGSNMMSVSSDLLEELILRGVTPTSRGVTIRIALGRQQEDSSSSSNPNIVDCTYTTKDYVAYNQLNIRDNLPFDKVHAANVLIIGTLFMKNSIIEFDCEQHTVGWKQLGPK